MNLLYTLKSRHNGLVIRFISGLESHGDTGRRGNVDMHGRSP